MFSMSMLPDLTPRDPHNLWYTSRHAAAAPILHHLPSAHDPIAAAVTTNQLDGAIPHNQNHQLPQQRDRDQRRALVDRTPLARLRHDEALMERRRANVSNYGSAWLKPPGVPKTLFQMREERREAEEQAETLRREQMLNAQIAEAELAGDEDEDEQQVEDDDGQEQDLDDEIPEGEGLGFDEAGEETDEEERSEGDGSVAGSHASGGGDNGDYHAGAAMVTPAQREEIRDMRAAEDRVREMIARGEDVDSEVADIFEDDQEAENMLEEDDLVRIQQVDPDANHADLSMGMGMGMGMGMDMDMDADLDGEVPEGLGDDDGYEHTDSEEEITDDGTRDMSFAGRSTASGRTAHGSRLRRSLQRSHPRSSLQSSHRPSLAPSDMDISALLSINESSYLEEYQMGRRG